LLDAAERLLLEEGYAAVTSRRVAAEAQLKPQLVHYYFRTMDDLFVEVFRRRADQNLESFEQAVSLDPSLHTLWRLNRDPRGAASNIEFVALAKHRPAVREEIAKYADRYRVAQQEALAAALAAGGIDVDQIPPVVALVLMTGLTQVIALEESLGITAGHDDVVAFIERVLDEIEPSSDAVSR
jgi:AcrR family transcriptional regulator